ncbi:hypothetical protein [Roseivirga thermotolerans]|uniref:Uncharacterized protein n=1 Tax=Roseivirga thermotolerans TaxID=1758176 RepID=A0ABQ3ICK7_9BACT|nr:hypothetical protein [Roseivirga thermotolerans]GHE73200.1 hypothetical protein GCM10011340_32170 [Roseivirga thermotolerans]
MRGINLNEGAVEVYSTLKGGEAKAARKELRAAKKEALDECKTLKGKAKRDCKKNVRRNFRKSKNNVIRDGETWVSTAVNKVANIATPLTSLASDLVPGASFIQSGLTALTGQKMTRNERSNEQIQTAVEPQGGALGTAQKILDLFKGTKQTQTTAPKSENSKTVMKEQFTNWMAKAKSLLSDTRVKIGLGLVAALAIGVWAWKKFRKGSRPKPRKL